MFVEEYPIDTQHTTNTGKHTATIELVEGVYTVNYEIDDTADVTYLFVEDGELKSIKTKESPILPLTDHALKRLNEDWTFNV